MPRGIALRLFGAGVARSARRASSGRPQTVALSNDLLVSLSMNYKNDGQTNDELVSNLARNGLVCDVRVERLLRAVDRADFDAHARPYEDKPHDIGHDATISSAHMHAVALDALASRWPPASAARTARGRALDVGCGSGFVAVCLALLLGEGGRALGVDVAPGLVALSAANTRKRHGRLLDSGAVRFAEWDAAASTAAYDDERLGREPFDLVHVGFALPREPEALLSRVRVGGALVAPIAAEAAGGEQSLMLFAKGEGGDVQRTKLMACVYAPMFTRGAAGYVSAVPEAAAVVEREATRLRGEMERAATQLREWQSEFARTQGRRPGREEIAASQAFAEHQRLAAELRALQRRRL
jgi:protein-L-isoaspartate(D-aspartate) O-methyltransferase